MYKVSVLAKSMACRSHIYTEFRHHDRWSIVLTPVSGLFFFFFGKYTCFCCYWRGTYQHRTLTWMAMAAAFGRSRCSRINTYAKYWTRATTQHKRNLGGPKSQEWRNLGHNAEKKKYIMMGKISAGENIGINSKLWLYLDTIRKLPWGWKVFFFF